MNLTHLKYFYDAARMKSVSKSSEINFVGQPAISKGIKNLEQELGVELLGHKRNSFSVTEEGRLVFEKCLPIFQAVDNLKTEVESHQKTVSGPVRFACSQSMALTFVADGLSKLTKNYPQIYPQMDLGRDDVVTRFVREGRVELGLAMDNHKMGAMDSIVVKEGLFRAIKTKKYKGDCSVEGIMVTQSRPETEVFKKAVEKKYKAPFITKMEIGSWQVIKQFVDEGLGIGLLPDYLVEDGIRSGKYLIAGFKELKIGYQILALTQKGHKLSRNGKLFLHSINPKIKF